MVPAGRRRRHFFRSSAEFPARGTVDMQAIPRPRAPDIDGVGTCVPPPVCQPPPTPLWGAVRSTWYNNPSPLHSHSSAHQPFHDPIKFQARKPANKVGLGNPSRWRRACALTSCWRQKRRAFRPTSLLLPGPSTSARDLHQRPFKVYNTVSLYMFLQLYIHLQSFHFAYLLCT